MVETPFAVTSTSSLHLLAIVDMRGLPLSSGRCSRHNHPMIEPTPEGGLEASGTGLSTIVNTAGVPATLKSKALRAISRLIGGTMLAPVVAQARENLDTIEGRSKVNMMLAEAVAKQAIADPEIMERAKARFLGAELRKQENVENVAVLALEDLRNTGDAPPEAEAPDVEDDWLNVFSRHAEDASSERMRRLWAKVLAGKIRKAGSFSLSTMRFVAELDRETAEDFRFISQFVIDDIIYKNAIGSSGEHFERTLRLETAGLLSGAAGSLQRTITFKSAGVPGLIARGQSHILLAEGEPTGSLNFPILLLSRTGRELAPLVSFPCAPTLNSDGRAGGSGKWFWRVWRRCGRRE